MTNLNEKTLTEEKNTVLENLRRIKAELEQAIITLDKLGLEEVSDLLDEGSSKIRKANLVLSNNIR